jgi:hypothetical protein
LNTIRAALAQQRGDPNNGDFSVTNIEVEKQGVILSRDVPNASALHVNSGAQREVAHGLVIGADFVLRRFSLGVGPDVNRFFSASGPVLPVCTVAQRNDPKASCSLGPIIVLGSGARATYKGVLVRAEKRLSRNWQLLASYAYSSNTGHTATGTADPLESYGPLDRDVRHILNVSGSARLPFGLQLGTVLTYYSKPPFSARLGGIDLNGDGITGDPLPGTEVNSLNRGTDERDLRELVDLFNRHKPPTDPLGRPIPSIALPDAFAFGDNLFTQDLRLSRTVPMGEHARLILIGEVFNLFNIANLSGHSTDLLAPAFSQPTSRLTQVFGSGGPRSFQLATRIEF